MPRLAGNRYPDTVFFNNLPNFFEQDSRSVQIDFRIVSMEA